MTSEELKRLHADYRVAVEGARKPESEEAAAAAEADLIDKRHALDAALIEKEQEREDDARMAAVEEREAAAKASQALETAAPQSLIPYDEIRSFAEKKTNQVSFTLSPVPEKRVDLTVVGTTAYSNYLVPEQWYSNVVMSELAQSGVLRAGPTIINTPGDNTLHFPKLSTDMTSAKVAEGVTAGATYPVFDEIQLKAYRIDGYLAITDEFIRSSNQDISNLMGELIGRSLGAAQAPYLASLAVGTGSSLPHAITVHATAGVVCVSQTTPTLDEMKTAFYAALPQYRSRGSWVGNSTITLQMAVAKDDDGNYMWQPSNMAAEPDRLFGRPWFEDGYMAASTTGLVPAVFGDISTFYVRYAGGVEISFSRDYLFPLFEVTCRWARWFDSNLIDFAGVKKVTLG